MGEPTSQHPQPQLSGGGIGAGEDLSVSDGSAVAGRDVILQQLYARDPLLAELMGYVLNRIDRAVERMHEATLLLAAQNGRMAELEKDVYGDGAGLDEQVGQLCEGLAGVRYQLRLLWVVVLLSPPVTLALARLLG
jgi:hypothetical protein